MSSTDSLSHYSEERLSKVDRVVVWFSAGSTSAIAAKLSIDKHRMKYPVVVCYCDTGSEHEDNIRFVKDCESWFNHPITMLKSEKYEDIWDVFEKTRYLVGPQGARCTTELKKKLRQKFQRPDNDIQVFGFDGSEEKRANDFRKNNIEVILETPLLDQGLSKQDCLGLLDKAGIEIPAMYKLGYRNNNCLGCPKGYAGYWNKIRKDFPEIFERMSLVEQELDISIIRQKIKGQKERKRIFLKDLEPNAGRYSSEPNIECGVLCNVIWNEMYDDDTEDCDD